MRPKPRLITLGLSAADWSLIRSLGEELGLETTGLLRLGLRALVAMGTSVADRSLLKRRCSRPASLNHCTTTMRVSPKDWQVISVVRKELGKSAGLSTICRIALHALAR